MIQPLARRLPCRRLLISLSFCLPLLVCSVSLAEEPAQPFMRVTRDANGELKAMETSIVSYAADANAPYPDATVDLVSAVHVGEPEYYDELNRAFKTYDAVLYELIAPRGTIPVPGEDGRPTSAVSTIQLAITDALQLEFQLKGIDYRAKNFVHADTSPDEFFASMERRGESFFQMFLRAMQAGFSAEQQQMGKAAEVQLLMLLIESDPAKRALGLKRLIAIQFKNSDVLIQAINGEEGSTLISGRNDAALEVLKEQLAAGKKKLAIFYGGGHMEDFDKKLRRDFKLHPTGVRWLEAWHLD